MQKGETPKPESQIAYSCYYTSSRGGEQFIPEHVFSYQISGTLTVNDGEHTYYSKEGDFRLSRRNHLMKFNKQPPADGAFQSVSIYLDQQMLRNLSIEYGYKAEKQYDNRAIIDIAPRPLYKSFMESLIPYYQSGQSMSSELQALKQREAILLLIQSNPELKHILFDFSEPGKIDLEGFMERNFHFNVQLKRFAYLTGRSLATFKRDFEKLFNTTPSRWLLHRRLQEAYYLIKEKGKAPSDVYLDLGFEDLSHFSFVFKKAYGVPPSRL
ncbi:helix-turn-helix transcriptional regulator [Inquilinus sp. KBS0705]|nr:helix-turn-helix transcriptional regulator [Inquilinus sp. KBS0705]